MNKIILTDWPKLEHIKANLRGVSTETLLKQHKQLFHTMMSGTTEEAGGYAITYNDDDIVKELVFRGMEKKSLEY